MDVKKTKVESLDIIVTMMEDKPYYEIKYKEIRQNQKEHYAGMAEHPPDRKASTDFHRPAYPNYTVEDALKKWGVDTKKGVDAGGAEH